MIIISEFLKIGFEQNTWRRIKLQQYKPEKKPHPVSFPLLFFSTVEIKMNLYAFPLSLRHYFLFE